MTTAIKFHMLSLGSEAAVAHGGCDFKFVNNNNFDIKILAEANTNEVIVKIHK